LKGLPALFILLMPFRSAAEPEAVGPAGAAVETLLAVSGKPLQLSHGFVLGGTERVSLLGGAEIPPGSYSMDYDRGRVSLSDSTLSARPVVIRYMYVPFPIKQRYSHSLLDLDTPSSSMRSPARATAARREYPSLPAALTVDGQKSFSVEFGNNKDLSLGQSLDLRLRGKISPKIRLNAQLTDRNLPFQPSGNTADLRELDRVLIRLEGEGFDATLGDHEFTSERSEFGKFRRSLKGFSASARSGRGAVAVAGAQSKGRFRTVELQGVEGKQGPYRLLEESGSSSGIVVAGSERVWIDGRRAKRGAQKDYTIDYNRATITFTAKHMIGSDTQIAVQFEYSLGAYERDLYGATWRISSPRGISVEGVLLREADNKKHPLGSPAVPGVPLASEGVAGAADPDRASGGIRFEGPGKGEYTKVYTDSVPPFYFLYEGEGQGEYSVDFVLVGPGEGSYVKEGGGDEGHFRFVGSHLGDYEVGSGLVPPVSHSLVDVAMKWKAGEKGYLKSELAFSTHDPDLVSSSHEGVGPGRALLFEGGVREVALGESLGRLSVTARVRSVGEKFSPFAEINPRFRWREWNAAPENLMQGELSRALEVGYEPAPSVKLGWKILALRSGDTYEGSRNIYEFRRSGKLSLHSTLDVARSLEGGDSLSLRGERSGFSGLVSYQAGPFTPSVGFKREIAMRSGASFGGGFWKDELEARLSAGRGRRGSLGILASWRHSRFADQKGWRFGAQVLSTQIQGTLHGLKGASVSGDYGLSRVLSAAGLVKWGELARIEFSQIAREGRLRNNLSYLVNGTELSPSDRVLAFVGEGGGEYDASGRYTGKGDFAYAPLGSGITGNMELVLRSVYAPRGSPGRKGNTASRWRGMRLSTRLGMKQLFQGDGPSEISPFSRRRVLKGSSSVGQKLELRPLGGWASVEIEWRRTGSVVNVSQSGGRSRVRDRLALGVSRRYSAVFTLEGRASVSRTRDKFGGLEDVSRVVRLDCGLRRRLGGGGEAGLAGAVASERGGFRAGRRSLLELGPTVNCGIPGRARLHIRMKWARVFPETSDSLRDSSLGYLWYRNYEFQADIERSVGSSSAFSISLSGSKHGDGKLVHRIKTELRAFF